MAIPTSEWGSRLTELDRINKIKMIISETPVRALATSDSLLQKVIGKAMHVHRVLGPGFLESIYQNVYFENEIVGNFQTDILVEDRLLLELKAVSVLTSAHEVQLVNYLTAIKLNTGLLLNFGSKNLEIKRRTREFLPTASFRSNPVNLINPF